MFKVTEELEAVLTDIYSKLNSVTAQADTNAEMILDHESRLSMLEEPVEPPTQPNTIQGFARTATGGLGKPEFVVNNVNEFLTALGSDRTIYLQFHGIHNLSSKIQLRDFKNLTIQGGMDPPMFCRGLNSDDHTIVINDCENIILKNFRVGGGHGTGSQRDAINIANSDLLALDHLTVLWGSDENIGIKMSSNITIQHCMIAEGLLPHSEGSLVREYTDKINFYRCLFAHNYGRNPQISNIGTGLFDIRNCVMYNEGVGGVERGCLEFKKDAKYNVMHNYYIAGADKKEDRDHANSCIAGEIFIIGNKFESVSRWLREEDRGRLVPLQFLTPTIETTTADAAYQLVLNNVGATNRNEHEKRVIESVINRSGRIIADRPI